MGNPKVYFDHTNPVTWATGYLGIPRSPNGSYEARGVIGGAYVILETVMSK